MKYQKQIEEFQAKISREVGGWCDPDKIQFLMNVVLGKKITRIYEIGVWEGKSALPMAEALRMQGFGCLYPVDSYMKDDAIAHGEDFEEQFCSMQKYKDFRNHVNRLGLNKYVSNMAPCSSYNASRVLIEFAGLLHIDGNHSEWSSIEDLVMWLPRLKAGGVLVLDDTGRESTQLQQQIAETRCEILKDAGQWKAYTKIK